MNDDLEMLAGIIELLNETEFTQFSFEQGDTRIAVSRGGLPLPGLAGGQSAVNAASTAGPAFTGQGSSTPTPAAAAPAESASALPAQVSRVASSQPASEIELAADEVFVRSPLLGTFYRASKPGASAFVEPGAIVAADTTLCIVEVMKLMNSVPAGVAGEIVHVLAADGELVEFNQPLFVVRTTA